MTSGEKVLRAPPAFQIYPADMLASECFYQLSVGARGLVLSIWFAAWVDKTVPAEPRRLAGAIRCTESEVAANLDEVLKSGLIQRQPGDSGRLMVDELERQRTRLYERRRQQASAGSRGGQIAQARLAEERRSESPVNSHAGRSERSSNRSSERSSNRSSALNRTEMSEAETSRAEGRSTSSTGKGRTDAPEADREFLDDYEAEEGGVDSFNDRLPEFLRDQPLGKKGSS